MTEKVSSDVTTTMTVSPLAVADPPPQASAHDSSPQPSQSTNKSVSDLPPPRNSPNSRQQATTRAPLRVLLTGFGPFAHHVENPSWLAVAPLHNKILHPEPVANDPEALGPFSPRPIHVSCLEIPVLYEYVSETVPKLHARPPVLPPNLPEDFPPPPASGYDFMFHIGVAGRGPLRMECLGHKFGYQKKDAKGNYAPLVRPPKDFGHGPDEPSAAEIMERDRLGLDLYMHESATDTTDTTDTTRPTRGFGPGYEICPEEITTNIDVTRLVHDLLRSGVEQIYSSMDAGHYLCDYIYYCSLAEAKRLAKPYEKHKTTQVLFLHCPPVDQPLTTEEVTDAIKRIMVWVCREIQIEEESDAAVDVVSVAPARK